VHLAPASVPSLSGVPGLVHGFERRLLPGVFESREETRARVADSLAAAGRLFLLKQVHGATVVQTPWEGAPEADAAVSLQPGMLVGVETADCLPLLFVDPQRRLVAAAHAGWRGSSARVAMRVVEAFLSAGARAEELLVALGPCIGPCCYEVGDEVRSAFGEEGETAFTPGSRGRAHLDLQAANALQLRRAGVPAAAITGVGECTRCRADLYHSYRREGKGAGRMINYVGFSLASRG
jgi:polyphenol oxidase